MNNIIRSIEPEIEELLKEQRLENITYEGAMDNCNLTGFRFKLDNDHSTYLYFSLEKNKLYFGMTLLEKENENTERVLIEKEYDKFSNELNAQILLIFEKLTAELEIVFTDCGYKEGEIELTYANDVTKKFLKKHRKNYLLLREPISEYLHWFYWYTKKENLKLIFYTKYFFFK